MQQNNLSHVWLINYRKLHVLATFTMCPPTTYSFVLSIRPLLETFRMSKLYNRLSAWLPF